MPIPSGLTTITVTSAYPAIDGSPLNGSVTFATLQPIMDSAGSVKFSGSATRPINFGTMQPIVLPCTDNSALSPTGFSYQVTETINGVAQTPYWISLPSTLGATVDLSALTPTAAPPSVSAFASSNTWTGTNTFNGETIVQAPVNAYDAANKAYVDAHAGSGAVASVFGRTGTIVAASGDYTAAQVGADPSGAATSALTAAESYADTYKLSKSANLSDLASAATARTNLGLGTAATQPSTAFDASGAAAAVLAEADLSVLLAPNNATREAFPRTYASGYSSVLTSGTVYCTAIALPAGLTVNNLAVMIGSTGFASVSHGWYALIDNISTVRAVTADTTTQLQTSFSAVKLAVSSFATTYTGVYYIALCVNATTMGTIIDGPSNLSTPLGVGPVLCGTAGTAMTTPPSVGSTLTVSYASGNPRFYGYTA